MVFRLPQSPVLDNVKHVKTSVGKIRSQSTSPMPKNCPKCKQDHLVVISLISPWLEPGTSSVIPEMPGLAEGMWATIYMQTQNFPAQKWCPYGSTHTARTRIGSGLKTYLQNKGVSSGSLFAKMGPLNVFCSSNKYNKHKQTNHTKQTEKPYTTKQLPMLQPRVFWASGLSIGCW